jgi:hypothetical protein
MFRSAFSLSSIRRSDVGNSNSHWIKVNLERRLEQMQAGPSTIITVQYYFYR